MSTSGTSGTSIVHAPKGDMVREETSTLDVIARLARDPSTNVDTVERLVALMERQQADARRTSYMASMARLQAVMPQVTKSGTIMNKDGRTVRSTFAKIEDVDIAIRPQCTAEGFSFSLDSKAVPGGTEYTSKLSHRDGHSETKTLFLPHETVMGCSAAQSAGSQLSFARRYLVMMHLNLVTRDQDDDASGHDTPITSDQLGQIHDKLTALEANETSVGRFLNYMASASLEAIPAANFARACNFLDEKLRQKAASR